jgi:hypothetical protein
VTERSDRDEHDEAGGASSRSDDESTAEELSLIHILTLPTKLEV